MHPYVAHNRFLRKNKRTRHPAEFNHEPGLMQEPDPEKHVPAKIKNRAYPGMSGNQPARGDIVQGQISRVMNFGAFVQVGPLTGLVHLSELAWKKVSDPGELISEGDTLHFKVINFNPETQKLALSRKALLPDPWINIHQHYPAGARVKGRVSKFSPQGVLVKLDQDLEGYIPSSELAWDRVAPEAADLLQVEQEIELVVLQVDNRSQRIVLSLKQARKVA
ncbi:MAG: S1 RNA-binding domain-containing protein [Proteobacteria bacterium]|nr:S1 RNA-binding domain-containing protein [Pseudomonadota bacterium]